MFSFTTALFRLSVWLVAAGLLAVVWTLTGDSEPNPLPLVPLGQGELVDEPEQTDQAEPAVQEPILSVRVVMVLVTKEGPPLQARAPSLPRWQLSAFRR